MRISRALYEEIVAHAVAEAPNECCGIVGSVDGDAVAVFAARNAAASPLRYVMDGEDQLRIQEEIEARGLDYGAIYHSHTRSAPLPSQTDINMALVPGVGPLWPGSLYIIVGLAGEEPEVRAFRIESDTPEEVALSVG
ncbi:MAG TPA: M67 family metallopeptidase [Solirubrobacteraceae bacterium]|nr:M67 family metallopeptidase [Solirubrobacteraceae bacterium]